MTRLRLLRDLVLDALVELGCTFTGPVVDGPERRLSCALDVLDDGLTTRDQA